ncbi:MAG: hypothetical protein ACKPB7_20440, partial [Sphaerospermopsis kisseleviana]
MGILNAIKGFLSSIPVLGRAKAAPVREVARISTSHSRNELQRISQPINGNEQETVSLPVGAQEFKQVLDYMTAMKKKLFG